MKRYRWIAGPLLAGALLMWPETALNAARQAMANWATAVAPALFPFMLLMPLLTCPDAAHAYERLLGRVMRPLLKLPGAAAPAIVIAMTAGSPAGAQAIVRVGSSAGLTKGQAERLILCLCGLGPTFLVSGVGASMLGNPADGWLLLRAQLLSQGTMLLLTRGYRGSSEPIPAFEDAASADFMRAAVLGVLGVCGYMVAFSILAAFCARFLSSETAGMMAVCALDLPSGAAAIAGISLPRMVKVPVLAAAAGFGGVCIAVQNLSNCKIVGIHPGKYLAARVVAAVLNAGYCAGQLGFQPSVRENLQKPLAISAFAAIILAIPVWFFLMNNAFINKRNFWKTGQFLPENGKKPQHVVDNKWNKRLHLEFQKS